MESNNSKELTRLEHLQSYYPANESRWAKTELLTLEQALFLSYGIEPPDLNSHCSIWQYFENHPSEVDPLFIYSLSKNAILAGSLSLYNRSHLKAKDFVKWADEKNIPIKKELFCRSIQKELSIIRLSQEAENPPQKMTSPSNKQSDSEEKEESHKQLVMTSNLTKLSKLQLGILQARILGGLEKGQKNKPNRYT